MLQRVVLRVSRTLGPRLNAAPDVSIGTRSFTILTYFVPPSQSSPSSPLIPSNPLRMGSTSTQTQTITAENVIRLFPDVNTSLANSHKTPTSDSDLQGYDEEQIRLMEEVCIVLDNDDNPIGSASKKVCTSLFDTKVLDAVQQLTPVRPSYEEHRRWSPPPCLLRVLVRLAEPIAPTTACVGKDHIPRHVDQHLLLAPSRRARGDRSGARGSCPRRTKSSAAEAGSRARYPGEAGATGQVPVLDPDPLQGAE